VEAPLGEDGDGGVQNLLDALLEPQTALLSRARGAALTCSSRGRTYKYTRE
jgi:hypothetical protein